MTYILYVVSIAPRVYFLDFKSRSRYFVKSTMNQGAVADTDDREKYVAGCIDEPSISVCV